MGSGEGGLGAPWPRKGKALGVQPPASAIVAVLTGAVDVRALGVGAGGAENTSPGGCMEEGPTRGFLGDLRSSEFSCMHGIRMSQHGIRMMMLKDVDDS